MQTIGIDLGTTNSCVAVCEGERPVVIPNAEGQPTTPSVVAYRDNGDILVGQAARRQAITNAANTIYAVKRFMGRSFAAEAVRRDGAQMPYDVVAAQDGSACIAVRGQLHPPAAISALILARIKQLAEDFLAQPVQQAVIAVPAYFDAAGQQATIAAAKLAGLQVLRIIAEPTAAALACDVAAHGARQVAVYDMGGGTFDVSLLRLNGKQFEVVAACGERHLGGEDFDNLIIDHLCQEFAQLEGIDLRGDRAAMQRVKQAAESVKHTLSQAQEAEINLPFIAADAAGAKHLASTMTRATLERISAPLIERSLVPCADALKAAGLRPEQLDDVLLVGGMTRMPRIRAQVAAFFGRPPNCSINPEQVVALGAAVHAASLEPSACATSM